MYTLEITDILEQVQATRSDHLRIPPGQIAASAALDKDLHIDSLDFAEICIELQDTFDVEIGSMQRFRTVLDIATFLDRRAPFAARNMRA
jgi:acyl carrier protein